MLAQSVDVQGEMEDVCSKLLLAIYDEPCSYSIRDGDGHSEELGAVGPVRRFRLRCYEIENALVTDDCLRLLLGSGVEGEPWEGFKAKAWEWIIANPNHSDVALERELVESRDRLRHRKIKAIRKLTCGIAGTKKPWEVVVGQAIAALRQEDIEDQSDCLASYLGGALVQTIVQPPHREVSAGD